MTKIENLIREWTKFDNSSSYIGQDYLASDLDDVCRTIVAHFTDTKSGKSYARSVYGLSANSTLKRLCYRLTNIMIADDNFVLLIERIERYRKDNRGRPANDENPFKICLSAIFAHAPDGLHSRDKARFGDELFYAHRHLIREGDLDRFITFCGTRFDNNKFSISDRVLSNCTEPYFRDSIVLQLGSAGPAHTKWAAYDDELVADAEEFGRFRDIRRQREAEEVHQIALARKKKKKLKKKRKKEQKAQTQEQQDGTGDDMID